jgi:hypothetical protein
MKKREQFCTTERCNVLFAALTEFHRLSFRDGTLEKGTFEKCLKNANADDKFKNYKAFIKEELVSRKLITAEFTRWNINRSEPTFVMAKSIIEASVKRLSKYNLEHKTKKVNTEEPVYPIGNKEVKKEILLSEADLNQLTEAIKRLLPKDTSFTIHNR